MSGQSLTFETAVQQAAAKGLVVRIPEADELFVDIDKDVDFDAFRINVETLKDSGYVRWWNALPSNSGLPHRHATVKLTEAVSDTERLLLQACLGSDRKRELLGWVRLKSGVRKHPTLFFEKPRHMPAIAAWLLAVSSIVLAVCAALQGCP